jgi:hypothetical protein
MRWPSLLAGGTGETARAAAECELLAKPAAIAEADRIRTALLVAVSHDLRTPLAAAKAAVSCPRFGDLQLTAEDHDELLATAEESLNQLAHLITSLLDVSRLQAGALPVFPRPGRPRGDHRALPAARAASATFCGPTTSPGASRRDPKTAPPPGTPQARTPGYPLGIPRTRTRSCQAEDSRTNRKGRPR